MREIKFKCYVRFLREVHNVIELRSDGSVITDGYEYAIEKDAIDLMQFTGWKDYNGDEIYEGDILECENDYLWVVGFANGSFVAQVPSDESEFVSLDECDFGLVGNIHENGDLL